MQDENLFPQMQCQIGLDSLSQEDERGLNSSLGLLLKPRVALISVILEAES